MKLSRRSTLATLVLAATLIAIAAGALYRPEPELDVHGLREDVEQALESVTIPEFRLANASAEEAIAALNGELKKHRALARLTLTKWNRESLPENYYLDVAQHRSFDEDRYELDFTDVPADELLRYVASLYGGTAGQKAQTIFILPGKGEWGPLEKRVFRNVDPAFFATAVTRPPPSRSRKQDVRGWFRDQGVIMPRGATAYYYPGSRVVAVQSTRDDLNLCDAIMEPGGCTLGLDLSTASPWHKAWYYTEGWTRYYWGKVRDRTDLLFY